MLKNIKGVIFLISHFPFLIENVYLCTLFGVSIN